MIAYPRKGWTEPGLQTLWQLSSVPACGNARARAAFSRNQKGSEAMKVVDDHVEVTETEASSGVKGHNVRYVLAISLIAVIIVLSAVWIIPALLQP